jgi:GGDEF domain-containing protein
MGEEKAKRAIIDRRIRTIKSRRDLVGVYPESLPSFDGRLATVPTLTKGGEALAEKEADCKVAEASGDPLVIEEATLDYQIEKARRDGGTGLLERGVHYEDLEKSIKEGTPMKMAFVDMGFLRYFDNRGGADVGNNALKVAAELMEKAIDKAGIDANAYRYGGDEFTVQIKGGDEDLEKFKQALEQLRDEAGAIPSGRLGDAKGYVPTELVFNAGYSDMKIAEDVFESLKEAGVYTQEQLTDPDELANVKAELMTVVADKSIETDKAVNRFMMLAEARKDPRYESDPARNKQVTALIEFSKKALFAEAGGNDFLESLVASEKDPQEMRKDVEAWVATRVEAAHEQQNKKESLLGDLIKLHGKISFFESALAKSQKEQQETSAENGRLKADLEKLRAERQALIEVRKTLGP